MHHDLVGGGPQARIVRRCDDVPEVWSCEAGADRLDYISVDVLPQPQHMPLTAVPQPMRSYGFAAHLTCFDVFPAAEVQSGPKVTSVGSHSVRYAVWVVETVLNCPPGGLWDERVPLADRKSTRLNSS